MAARGLGKGLDILIPSSATESSNKSNVKEKEVIKEVVKEIVVEKSEVLVDINKVEPNREQPRKNFDEDSLMELSESIKKHGVIQPILVQNKETYYEIIAGERRWRASKIAGLKEVPVIIRKYTDQERVEVSLIENIQRENLNPIEEANAYKRLMTEFKLKQDEIAERVSKSRTAVTNSMRLLKLCDEVQQMIIDDMISTGHARAIIGIEDSELQYEIAQKIFDEKMSVREVEKYIKNLNKPQKEKKKVNESLIVIYQEKEEILKKSLSTKVNINGKGDGTGKIELQFYSHDEFDRLMEILTKGSI